MKKKSRASGLHSLWREAKMKAVVFTLGCKVNECESDSLIKGLLDRGYEVSNKLVKADLYIVNTCAVTAEAEKKSRQTCSRIAKLNPNAKVIFTGCACQKSPRSFADKNPNFLITGTFDKGAILQMLDSSGVCVADQTDDYEELLQVNPMGTRAFIKVQDGCNNFCSYCIIPYLRGRSRSRDPQSVRAELSQIKSKEAVITGINLTSYNFNGQGLTELISALKDADCRIRLGSLEVCVINREFLQALMSLKNFAPHFHLSLQSGSDAVLKKMNRRYTRGQFIDAVCLIREYFPNCAITTDVIVGFPTETEKDFEDTLNLIERVRFSDIHAFAFSPRQGTVAYKMPDLDGVTKKQRLDRLLDRKAQYKQNFANSQVGKTLEFLPEEFRNGYTEGYSENYLHLFVKGDLSGKDIVKVKVVKPYEDGAIAEII